MEDDGDHPAPGVDLGDHRLLGLDGEGLDTVDRRLDVVEDLAVVGVLLELDGDGPDVLARHGTDPLDPLDGGDGLLDPDADALLGLGRRGAAVGHADGDHVGVELGEDLDDDVGERQDARDQDEDHEDVGRHVVGGEPG